jgi:hypothetical protein
MQKPTIIVFVQVQKNMYNVSPDFHTIVCNTGYDRYRCMYDVSPDFHCTQYRSIRGKFLVVIIISYCFLVKSQQFKCVNHFS